MSLRERVSRLLGEMIPPDKWEETITKIDQRGGISQRQMLDMIIIILETLDKYENKDNPQP